jgi:hypothetical protein
MQFDWAKFEGVDKDQAYIATAIKDQEIKHSTVTGVVRFAKLSKKIP